MNNFSSAVPKLTKKALFSLLNSRFDHNDITKLSELPDPFALKDMQKAVERIKKAIKNREKIALVGDYDVDGVVSSVIVKEFFDFINYPLEVIIPNRFSDGYGVSVNILERVDASVIITVDNGISAKDAAKMCKDRSIDLIITDHHTCPEILPDAYAIINPKQPDCKFGFKEICGAAVAWYLIAALKKSLNITFDMKSFLDILAIATIADAVPLISINRIIVKNGLKVLQNSKRASIEAFKQKLAKNKFSSEDIGFVIAPKLNAAGRMNSAVEAYDFLRSATLKEATKWLDYLWGLNIQRKEIEMQTVSEAKKMLEGNDKVIVVWGEDWHEGVIGIVAARLVDAYKVPAIVLSINNGVAKGSARSIGNVDVYSLIKEQEDMLLGFGGHMQAAGMRIREEDIEVFKNSINESAKKVDEKDYIPTINLVGEMNFDSLDCECFNILEQFEPYGMANPKPLFLARDVSVVNSNRVGSSKDHLKLVLRSVDNNEYKNAMAFFSDHQISKGENVSFAFSLVKNEFRNEINFEFLIKEFF